MPVSSTFPVLIVPYGGVQLDAYGTPAPPVEAFAEKLYDNPLIVCVIPNLPSADAVAATGGHHWVIAFVVIGVAVPVTVPDVFVASTVNVYVVLGMRPVILSVVPEMLCVPPPPPVYDCASPNDAVNVTVAVVAVIIDVWRFVGGFGFVIVGLNVTAVPFKPLKGVNVN